MYFITQQPACMAKEITIWLLCWFIVLQDLFFPFTTRVSSPPWLLHYFIFREPAGFLVTLGEKKGTEHFWESFPHFILSLKLPLAHMDQALPRPEGLPRPKAKLVSPSNERDLNSAPPIPCAHLPLPFPILDLKLCQLKGTAWLQLLFPTLLTLFISLNDKSGIATFVFPGFTHDSVWQCLVTLTVKKGFWCSEGPSCASACAHWSCPWSSVAATKPARPLWRSVA